MTRRRGRAAGKARGLRIADLKDTHSEASAIHAEFIRLKSDLQGIVDSDIVNLEMHLHRIAQGAYDVCEFEKRRDDSRLSGQFETAYIRCTTYINRIGPTVTLLQLV